MSKATDLANEINRVMKKDVLKVASDPEFTVTYIPTGVLPIDILIGGGVPRGRVTELYGDWSTMKTYIGLSAIAQAQAAGGTAVMIDTEHSYDPEWAESIGVDTSALLLQHPETGEEAIDAVETAVRMKCDLVLWDSVAATLPKDEQEQAATDKVQPGRLAFLMSRGLRKLNTANSNTALIFTNQIREKIGVRWGSPETTPGGRALPFYASMRVNLRKAGKVREKGDGEDGSGATIGMKIRASVEKSKVNAPQRDTIFVYSYEEPPGVDMTDFLTNHGLAMGYVVKKGQKWSAPGYSSKEVVYRSRWDTLVNEDDDLYEYLRNQAKEYTA